MQTHKSVPLGSIRGLVGQRVHLRSGRDAGHGLSADFFITGEPMQDGWVPALLYRLDIGVTDERVELNSSYRLLTRLPPDLPVEVL